MKRSGIAGEPDCWARTFAGLINRETPKNTKCQNKSN
jgi:hypothetical protein